MLYQQFFFLSDKTAQRENIPSEQEKIILFKLYLFIDIIQVFRRNFATLFSANIFNVRHLAGESWSSAAACLFWCPVVPV